MAAEEMTRLAADPPDRVAGLPRARIVAIQDGQHNLHLVAPDELGAAMDRWLEGLAAGH